MEDTFVVAGLYELIITSNTLGNIVFIASFAVGNIAGVTFSAGTCIK